MSSSERAASGRPPSSEIALLARAVAEAVPGIVDRLVADGAPRVHREAMALLERPLLAHVLALMGGNQLRAARLLGLNRNTLRKRCRALGLRFSRRAPRRRVPASRTGAGGAPPPRS